MEEEETKSMSLDCTQVANHQGEQFYPNISTPYKNGVSRLELLMSMTGDMNRNLPGSGMSAGGMRSVLDGEADADRMRSHNHHASQLLKAAASVVSNGLHPFYKHEPVLTSHPQGRVNDGVDQPYAGNSPAIGNSTTVVSFASKPTMSTGFPSSALVQAKFSDTRMLPPIGLPELRNLPPPDPLRDNSPKVNPMNLPGLSNTTSILVPLLWKRLLNDGVIVYHSPSSETLSSLEEVKKYLLSEDTCKCGLSCPFHVEKMFNFDPAVESQQWKLSDLDKLGEESVRKCCHRKHIKSTALAKECKALPKPAKPSPSRRRAKPSQKAVGKKSVGVVRKVSQMKGMVEDGVYDGLSIAANAGASAVHSTPIPPIETVMRGSMYTSLTDLDGIQSPRQPNDASSVHPMVSMHSTVNPAAHMMPMMAAGSYPSPSTAPFPSSMYRHAVETEMMSPGGPMYFPGMQGMPPAHAPMPPYQHAPGYEYMQAQSRPWASPPPVHSMPPPAGSQFGPTPWPVRPENHASNSRKRRRRTSSISSNGGNSDTGYTSGLSSPVHTSPSHKVDNSAAKSKVNDERKPAPVNESSKVTKPVTETNGLERSLSESKTSEANGNHQQDVGPIRHTSVIKSPDPRVTQSYAATHIPNQAYGATQQRVPKPNTSSGYHASPHQPLPPIQLSERPPPATLYAPQHTTRAQVIRGVYSRPPVSTAAAISSDSVNKPTTPNPEVDAASSEDSNLDASNKLSNSVKMSAVDTEPQDLSKTNGLSQRSTDALLSQHTGTIPPSHFVQQSMYMNGLQAAHLNPRMVAPMRYHPPGHPGLHPDYGYPPNQPVMIRAPNGHIFYRYAQPRIPMTPQAMPYPVDNPMYSQMAFMANQGAPFGYPSSSNPASAASPKRKRKKTGAKTVIESHSAVLAQTDVEPASTTADRSAENDKSKTTSKSA